MPRWSDVPVSPTNPALTDTVLAVSVSGTTAVDERVTLQRLQTAVVLAPTAPPAATAAPTIARTMAVIHSSSRWETTWQTGRDGSWPHFIAAPVCAAGGARRPTAQRARAIRARSR
jgi:hypothetical protein